LDFTANLDQTKTRFFIWLSPVLLGHKTPKREAALRAASLFGVLICPDTSGDSYKSHAKHGFYKKSGFGLNFRDILVLYD